MHQWLTRGRPSKCCPCNPTNWNWEKGKDETSDPKTYHLQVGSLMTMWPKCNPGTLMICHLSLYIQTPPLTMSLGCVVLTCHTVAFVLCLLAFSCLVLLHLTRHFFLCHVSSDEGSARRDNRKLWQIVRHCFHSSSAQYVGLSESGCEH